MSLVVALGFLLAGAASDRPCHAVSGVSGLRPGGRDAVKAGSCAVRGERPVTRSAARRAVGRHTARHSPESGPAVTSNLTLHRSSPRSPATHALYVTVYEGIPLHSV